MAKSVGSVEPDARDDADGTRDNLASCERAINAPIPSFGRKCSTCDTKPSLELYEIFPEGAALVLDSGGYSGAVCFGENVALSLKMRGCTGIVTDGPIRDRNAMVELGLPVYASYVTPLSSGRQWVMLELDVSVTLPGESTRAVTIHSGDVIVGDDDGVVIVPRDLADAVCTAAEKATVAEERVRQRILNGESPKSAYAAEPRY